MIEHVLDALDRRGCPTALLDATERGAPLYERYGFVNEATAYSYERVNSASESSPGEDNQAANDVHVARNGDLDAIMAVDAETFGGDRGKLLREHWDAHRDRCLVSRDQQAVLQGFLFARDPVLGAWVATSTEAAEALLLAAMACQFEHTPNVLVPRSDESCRELLSRHGFIECRRLRHMRRGAPAPGKPASLFGHASFAHG